MTRDKQVHALTVALMKLTTRTGVDIGQCAEAHLRCLVSLAIEQNQVPPAEFIDMAARDLRGMFDATRSHTVAVRAGEDVH